VERLSGDGTFPQECFACSARIFIEGGYSCDPNRLDDKSLRLNIARYRPVKCPKGITEARSEALSAETILRKLLGK
jgi:hypothetical protein